MTKSKKKIIKSKPIHNPAFDLIKMLEWKRPSGTKSGDDFVNHFLDDLDGSFDFAGNYIVRVGQSKVLWSSHTDTVHSKAGLQRIVLNGDTIKVAHGEQSNCLGADCSTGIWLMREMIKAGVHGLYVFHSDEEIGGIGSAFIAKHNPSLLRGIDYAIAFDRRGFDSIITHQAGQRTASNDFANSIARMLPHYQIDSGGTFTDTANYSDLVPECSNISVGYMNAHTANETQSLSHALKLREYMLAFDETKLIASRNPCVVEYGRDYYGFKSFTPSNYANQYDLYSYVRDNYDIVADYLEQMGISIDDLEQYSFDAYSMGAR